MLTFLKDLLAFVALGGFSVASLTWVDIAARLSCGGCGLTGAAPIGRAGDPSPK